MDSPITVDRLIEEYRSILLQGKAKTLPNIEHSPDKLKKLLVRDGDWTPDGADHLLMLANDYGSFMLRNALALSIVLGIEDGELGL